MDMKPKKRKIQANYGKYTLEMCDWLLENYTNIKLDDMTARFNKKFNATFTKSALWHKANRLKYGQGYKAGYRPRVKWTPELKEFVAKNYEKYSYNKLAGIINKKFGVKVSVGAVEHVASRLGLKKSPEALKLSWNKKALSKFWFKKGQIGTEVNSGGYIWVKVANPGKWQQKHRLIWEQHRGEIPAGHFVIFLDGNKSNFDIDNLALITRGENGVMNNCGYRAEDAKITRAGLLVARLKIRVNEKIRERSKRHGNKKQVK